MTYRSAFFYLVVIIFVASAIAFLIVRDQITTPDWQVAIAVVVAVGGAILAFLPKVHDSVEFLKGMSQRVAGNKETGATTTYDIDSPRQRRNREDLLSNMQQTWVEGLLHRSLHNMILIELGMEYDRTMVSRDTQPWNITLHQDDQDAVIPRNKTIADVFVENARNLLILGAPGSGKTITLLQLAQALIAEAQADIAQPIPVVLNLSSWSTEKGTIAEWVAEEMFKQYQTRRELTYNWLQHDQILLLLDALDEVTLQEQEACITAINQFKKVYSAEMVVCSRYEEYQKLSKRLNLTTAVRLQALSLLQIQRYLDRFGDMLRGFRDALDHDTALQALSSSPLVLSLVPLAYGGRTAVEIPRSESPEAGRSTLFQNYVQQMFRRRPLPARTKYTSAQALQWLCNMGNRMGNETDFYIERLQPTWLSLQKQHLYWWLIVLHETLLTGLIMGQLGWFHTVRLSWMLGGLFLGLLLGVFSEMMSDNIEIELKKYWYGSDPH